MKGNTKVSKTVFHTPLLSVNVLVKYTTLHLNCLCSPVGYAGSSIFIAYIFHIGDNN